MKLIYVAMFSVVGLALSSTGAGAQTWPTKPLRAVVPVAVGSTTDIIPRIVLEQLSSQLGQSIIVENRAGAGATIGAGFVAKADPDGYTMLAHGSAHTISPSLYSKLNYHPARDFAAVVPLGITPSVLVVPPARGWKTVGDFVAAAKAKPGALNFSSVGIGTATHLSAERFRVSAGVDAVHVPFKGGAEAMSEVMAGRIDFFFCADWIGAAAYSERESSLALVVNARNAPLHCPTYRRPSKRALQTPSIRSGSASSYLQRRRARSSTSFTERRLKALQTPKVRDRLSAMGVDPMVMTPSEFDAYVEREIAVNAALVKAAGIRPE